MAKINHITIKDVTRYLETIAYLSELPTATEDSADLVSVNNTLYVKQVTDGVYSYGTIQAGDAPSEDAIDINVNLEDISVESALDTGYLTTLPLDETTLTALQTNPRRSIHVHGFADGTEVIQGKYLYSSDIVSDTNNGYFYGAADVGFLSLVIAEMGINTDFNLSLVLGQNIREFLLFNPNPDEPALGIITFIGDTSSSVVANPSEAATSTLTKLTVDDVVYGIPQGTSVEANTSDEATGTLNKLKVANVTYAIPVVEIEDLTSL